MAMSQAERLFYIDRHIRENGGMTAQQAADHFEVSPRQIKRDIEYLRDRLGAPLQWVQARNRYEYAETWNHLAFGDERTFLAFAFIRAILSGFQYIPVVSEHVLEILKEHIPRAYAGIADKVRYELPQMEAIQGDVAQVLCQALLGKRWVAIEYTDAKGKTGTREIAPLRLINYGGKWYCAAFDALRQELRTFSLGRISTIQLSQATLGLDIPEADIETFLTSSYGIFKGKQQGTATLRFFGGAARSVKEQQWHPDQVLTVVDAAPEAGFQGEAPVVELTLPVHDWTELLGRALRCGRNCDVLHPAEFREAWKKEIRAMADRALLY
jgi:predicted DNA-binding transcriptional regulator YafY